MRKALPFRVERFSLSFIVFRILAPLANFSESTMSTYDEIEKFKAKVICIDCFEEPFLNQQIQSLGESGKCSYCDAEAECYSIEDLSIEIESAFEQHYRRTSDQPTSYQYAMLSDKEFDYNWGHDGEQTACAIMNAAIIPEDAAKDIQQILEYGHYDRHSVKAMEETEFARDAHYEEADVSDQHWQREWQWFEEALKTEARFFSQSASQLLSSVFNGIDQMQTHDGRYLVVEAGPETSYSSIFRARYFQSNNKLKQALSEPDLHLGPPPSECANAGRMNAHGISVFYGATTPEVAIAEVRPPVGSQVAVARFDVIEPLRFLDLTALKDVTTNGGSIFDPEFLPHLERTAFLRNLSDQLTKPVMPDDERLEYLSTQVIADFLASENAPTVDGIVFPSIQSGKKGLNIVIFHNSSCVEKIEHPEGTEFSASTSTFTDVALDTPYYVCIRTPKQEKEPETEQHGFINPALIWNHKTNFDARQSKLKIDQDTIKVHRVDAVTYSTSEFPVTYSIEEKTDSKNLPF